MIRQNKAEFRQVMLLYFGCLTLILTVFQSKFQKKKDTFFSFLTADLDSLGQNWSSTGWMVKSLNFDIILRFFTGDGFGECCSGLLDGLLDGTGSGGEHLSTHVVDEQLEMFAKAFCAENGGASA